MLTRLSNLVGLAALALVASCADPNAPHGAGLPPLAVSTALYRDTMYIADENDLLVRLAPGAGQPTGRRLTDAQWTSSDTTVVALAPYGTSDSTTGVRVDPRGPGRATISGVVRANDGSTATVSATVVVRGVYRLALWPNANTLLPGMARTLDARNLTGPWSVAAAPDVRWVSDAPDVAAVDSSGRVVARAPGRATVSIMRAVPGGGEQRASAVVIVRTYSAPLQFAAVVTGVRDFGTSA